MELALDLSKRYTYADFLTWVDDVRRELWDGVVKLMGSPRGIHQRVEYRSTRTLDDIITRHGGRCRVYHGFDVCFPSGGESGANKIRTVVRPDVIVVCDLSKVVDDLCCMGAPDLVIEIQSPSTAHRDLHYKYELYESEGVREYWVVHPLDRSVLVFTPGEDGKYGDGVLYESGSVPVSIFGGELIELSSIFE